MTLSDRIKNIVEREPQRWIAPNGNIVVDNDDYYRISRLARLSAELVEKADNLCREMYANDGRVAYSLYAELKEAINKAEKLLSELGAE